MIADPSPLLAFFDANEAQHPGRCCGPARGGRTLTAPARSTVLETARLVVTTWLRTDVDDLLTVHSDPETMLHVRHGRPETRSEVADLIDSYLAEHDRTGVTRWRIADREGQLVGRAGFGPFDQGRGLNYTIRRELWGRGLATELAAALVTWHRRYAPGLTLWAYVSPENPASARVLEKAGFEPAGTVDHDGECCPLFRLP